MALGAMVYKAQLSISNLDRGWYGQPVLTIARHPSETEKRLMLRVLAWCVRAGEHLEFGRGLSSDGEPALWETDDTGAIIEWVELGAPDVRTVKGELSKIDKLTVIFIPDSEADALAAMALRSMKFAVTIQDRVIWVNSDTADVQINPEYLKRETQRWT